LSFFSSRSGRLVVVVTALLMRGCAFIDTDTRFPEPPISPAWHQGVSS
jgi:hypothetical protein